MATVARREHQHQTAGAAKIADAPSARTRWLPLALVLLAMLAAVVWLLPGIVVHTPLLRWGLKMATADLNGSVAVESASLGWFSPVAVQGVEVKDAEGKPVLTMTSASGDRWLSSILWNYKNLGRFRLESPKLSLVLRDDGTNVEDLLAKYLAPTENKSSTSVGLALDVVDGSLSVTDQRLGRSWQVRKLEASFEMSEAPDGPMTAKVSADLPDARKPGKLTVGMKMAAGSGEAMLSAANVPLVMCRALAARFAPGTTLTGQLSSDLRATWGSKNSVEVDISADTFSLGTPALQTDVVLFDRLHAGCLVSWKSDSLEVEKSSVDCDAGSVSLSGTVRLGEKDGFSLNSLARQRYEANGRVDLARLARLLPATLRLRQQVEIKSGQVVMAFSSQPAANASQPEKQGMKWHAQLDAANLTATASGRQIAWERPMSLVFDAHEAARGPIVDALRCESDFLKIHAAGTPDDLVASMSFNLKQLSDQLGQFVDLGTMQLAGEGWGNLNWKRSPQQLFDADAEIRLKNFQLALLNQPPWREDDLLALLSAKGQTNLGVETRIDAATLSIKAGADQFDARLAQPVKDLRNGGEWPVHVQAQGQLQSWPGRLAAWLPMKDCRFAGAYAFDADGTASKDGADLRQVRLAAAPLIVSSPWVNINEPRLDASVAGSWNQQQRRLQIEPASLTCATVAMQANNVVLATPEKGPMEATGSLKYQGDAARLRRWFSDPAKPLAWQLAGQLGGTAQLHQTAGVIRGETTAEVNNLAVVDATGQQFQEPRVRLTARGDYDNKAGVLQLEQFELVSDALGANAAGHVTPVSGVKNADIKGKVNYDLERLAGLMRPYIGSGVRIAGRGSSTASYRGPFALATGSAAADFRWDAANVYGLQLGPGELKAAMANGMLQVEPVDMAVSGGRMRLAPGVRLTSDPIELTMPKGPLAQKIQIDPAMCGSMFKYIAPVLADVTTARGAFSIELDDEGGRRAPCRIPLSDPAKGELTGRFIIHSIEIGPGPLIRELAVFNGREAPAKLRQESVVQFQMVKGRVYHQGMELMFPDFTIRTYGSVGLDQTMAIMAEMPVPPKWLEANPIAGDALRGQIIKVPINGTLSKPKLDQKVLADLTRQFMQKAAGNMIEGEVNRQLDRLFGPRK